MMDTDPTRPDLQLVATEWLVDELFARTDAIVIAFIPKANPDAEQFIDNAGGRAACLGMLEMLKARILHKYLAERDAADAEDDDADDDDD